MSDDLIFNIIATLDGVEKKLDSIVAKSKVAGKQAGDGISEGITNGTSQGSKKAGDQGSQAGRQFGQKFAQVASVLIGTQLFSQIANLANDSIAAFDRMTKSEILLTGAVDSFNNKARIQNAVLNDVTASQEEKARAIGLTTDQIYEEVSATRSAANSNKALEQSIKMAERALEDSTNAIEKQINSIEKNIEAINSKRNAEIKAVRDSKGFNKLTEEQQKLESELASLEVERLEAVKGGNNVLAQQIEDQIKIKEFDLSLADARIKKIDLETDAITSSYEKQTDALESQVVVLRSEISAKKNQFDIDIEPAKRKLEDLQSAVSGGGGGTFKKMRDDVGKMIQESIENPIKELDFNQVRQLTDNLYQKFGGIIAESAITQGVGDLLRAGVSDMGEIEKLLTGFADIAASGKAEGVSMSSAVAQLTEQFRNNRAALGETAGLSDEYLSDIIPRGLEKLQQQGLLIGKNTENLTDNERALAATAGLQENFDQAQGAFNKQLENGNLATEQAAANFLKLQQSIGAALKPFQKILYDGIIPLIEKITDFTNENPKLVASLLIVAAGFVGFLSIVGVLGLAVVALGAVFTATGGLIVLALGLVGGAIALAVLNWENLQKAGEKVGESINQFFSNVGNQAKIFGSVVSGVGSGIIGTIGDSTGALQGLLNFIVGGFTGQWDQAWKGIKDIFLGFVKSFSNGFVDGLNSTIDALNSFLKEANKIGNNIESISGGKINVSDFPTIAKMAQPGFNFENGGLVPGTSYSGDNVPVFANSGEMFLNRKQQVGLFDLIKSVSNGGNVTNNSVKNLFGVNFGSEFENSNFIFA